MEQATWATTEAPPRKRAAEARSKSFSIVQRRGLWKDALRRRLLALADVMAALLGAVALGLVQQPAAALWAAAAVPLWVLLAKARGLYDADHVRIRHQTIDEFSSLFHWTGLCVAITGLGLALAPGDLVTAGSAVVMWATSLTAAFVLRVAARWVWRRVVPAERALVLGDGEVADALVRKLALEPGHHLTLVQRSAPELDEVAAVVERDGIERVIVALQDLDEHALAKVTATCRPLGVKLSVAPPMRAMLGTAVELSHLAELPLIEFRTGDVSRSTMFLKRVADVVGASIGLCVLSPVIALTALCIKLDSRGPVIFRQRRAGEGGKPFWMFKFRTMIPDAERQLDGLVEISALQDPMFKLRTDPRVTRVGRWLRRYSLDELPQLFNVLKGDMSLVGPRPEEVWLVERYGETESFRLVMRPGITGPMQVHGRGELTFQERMAVEREYVDNYSLRKDIQILLRTFSAVLGGRGAF